MSNHFSAIGFQVNDQGDLSNLLDELGQLGLGFRLPAGRNEYLVCRLSGGEELWWQLDARNRVIGCNPHWRGEASVPLEVTRWHTWPEHPLDGRVLGTIHPELAPIVLDVPNAARHGEAVPADPVDAQVAAFADEISAWASEAEFNESQQDRDLRFAPRSFVPSGMFRLGVADGLEPVPDATAMLTGVVRRTSMKTNPVSRLDYVWAEVETLGGTFDVVSDPSLLQGSEPLREGGVVQGSFWLSGIWPVEAPRRSRRFWWNR